MSRANAATQTSPDFVTDLDLHIDERGRRHAISPGCCCQCLLFDRPEPVVAYDARPLIAEPLPCGETFRVSFVCLSDAGAAILATAGKFLVFETRLIGIASVLPGSVDPQIYKRSELAIDTQILDYRKLATDLSGWNTLYEDPQGRLWEVSYPIGDVHGGGPRRLALLDNRGLAERYPRIARARARGV